MESLSPVSLVLFGLTGDLSRKKILPAWWYLFQRGLLPDKWRVIGVGRRTLSELEMQDLICSSVEKNSPKQELSQLSDFLSNFHYISGDLRADGTYRRVLQLLSDTPQHAVAVYISTLPSLYPEIVAQLKHHQIFRGDTPWKRLLIEKPFGMDVASSLALNELLQSLLPEKDIYRIDHYLAKETVQNILAFRFANGVFEHLWNHRHIDHIQLTYAESNGVEGREEFYNEVGIVRDVLQNHVLQLLSVILMEEPTVLEAGPIQHQRLAVLSEFSVLSPKEVESKCTFGQYQNSRLKASVPTAVAVELAVQNERWSGVPIYVRAGKKLKTSVIEASIFFKEPLNRMFGAVGQPQFGNVLTIRIQPNEGIALWLNLKRPGLVFAIDRVPMSFCYRSGFASLSLVEAYSKVLFDALRGDSSLFLDAKGTDACWRIVEPFLSADIDRSPTQYPIHSWGPNEFNELLPANRTWLEPDLSVCNL